MFSQIQIANYIFFGAGITVVDYVLQQFNFVTPFQMETIVLPVFLGAGRLFQMGFKKNKLSTWSAIGGLVAAGFVANQIYGSQTLFLRSMLYAGVGSLPALLVEEKY